MSEQLNNGIENNGLFDEWNKLANERLDKFKENAAQELMEREMNAELTKVEDLKIAIEAGEKGIAGGEMEIPFKDGSIHNVFLIVLKGYPFKTLQSDITLINTNDISGAEYGATKQTGENLRNDPSLWIRKKDEVEGLGKSASAVFSASYYDTEVGVPKYMGGYCSYGFDHVRPNTVVDVIKGDGNTLPAKDFMNPEFGYTVGNKHETPPTTLKELADVGHSMWTMFNEVIVNRYDETGNPQKPDYILARGREGMNGLTIRHAEYHNVPLICIMPECYKEIKDEDEVEWDPEWDDFDEEEKS